MSIILVSFLTNDLFSFFTDVCGFVVAIYERGMEGVQDISKREVVLVMEDTGVLAVRLAN